MNKYEYQGQVQEAESFEAFMAQAGIGVPENIDPNNHFVVRCWVWDKTAKDYVIEKINGSGHAMFNDYEDAVAGFNKLLAETTCLSQDQDMKLELVQYHRGRFNVLESRIIFPTPLGNEA